MGRMLRIMVVAVAAGLAGWWLFYMTPSRGGQEEGTIRFGFWGDYQDYRMWVGVVEAFERANPGVRVKLEYVPGAGEYSRKLTAWMASGTTPEVVLLQDEPLPRYLAAMDAGREVILDLTEMVSGERFGAELGVDRENYWETAWDSFGRREDGRGWRQYGLPVSGGSNLIFYNRECFRRAGVALPEEAGVDVQWGLEEFVELCRALTIRDGEGANSRVVQWGFNRPAGWLYWLPFIYACEAEILDESRAEFVFTDERALESLRLWDDLYRRYNVVPSRTDLGQMNENTAFLTGRVAMVTNGPWAMPFFNAAGMDYGVLLPPVSAAGRRGTRVTWDGVGLAGRLANDPRRLKTAYALARFIASSEAAEMMGELQRSLPAHKGGTAHFLAGKDEDSRERSRKFVAAMEFSRIQPITVRWDEMDWALRDALGRLTRGQATAEQTLEEMQTLILRRGIFPVRRADGTLVRPEVRR